MKKIKLIQTNGAASVVEWLNESGVTCRAIVPREKIETLEGKDFYAHEELLEMGIPYGDPFADFLPKSEKREALIHELHRHGIWYAKQIANQHQTVNGIVLKVFGAGDILRAARTYVKER